MSKKLPSSRLENLFAELEQRELPSDSVEVHLNAQPGWTWEANSQGTYIFCGPEVMDGLEISPIEWIGRSLFTYRLSEHSQKQLLSAIHLDQFPAEITGEYLDNSGRQVQVRMTIFSRHEENGDTNGWRGFNQVITKSSLAPVPGLDKLPQPNGKKPAAKKSTGPLKMPDLTKGFVFQDGKTHQADKPWTTAAKTSLNLNEFVTEVSQELMAAALAVPFRIGGIRTGLSKFWTITACESGAKMTLCWRKMSPASSPRQLKTPGFIPLFKWNWPKESVLKKKPPAGTRN